MAFVTVPELANVISEKGMTQRDVADRSGVSTATIWRANSGTQVSVRDTTAKKLAKALSVSVERLQGKPEIARVPAVTAGRSHDLTNGQTEAPALANGHSGEGEVKSTEAKPGVKVRFELELDSEMVERIMVRFAEAIEEVLTRPS